MTAPPETPRETTAASTAQDPNAPMTVDQADILRVLCENTSEPFDASLTQRQALIRIEELRDQLNRGQRL